MLTCSTYCGFFVIFFSFIFYSFAREWGNLSHNITFIRNRWFTRGFWLACVSRHWLCKVFFFSSEISSFHHHETDQETFIFLYHFFFFCDSFVFHFNFGTVVSQWAVPQAIEMIVCAVRTQSHGKNLSYHDWVRAAIVGTNIWMAFHSTTTAQNTSTESFFFIHRRIFHLKLRTHARSTIRTPGDSNAETHLWP